MKITIITLYVANTDTHYTGAILGVLSDEQRQELKKQYKVTRRDQMGFVEVSIDANNPTMLSNVFSETA